MKKINLNGWNRLFILIIFLYAGFLVAYTIHILPTSLYYIDMWGRYSLSSKLPDLKAIRIKIIRDSFLLWLLPLIAIYSVGYGISWVKKGFNK